MDTGWRQCRTYAKKHVPVRKRRAFRCEGVKGDGISGEFPDSSVGGGCLDFSKWPAGADSDQSWKLCVDSSSMEVRRPRRSGFARDATARTDRFSAPTDSRVTIWPACIVCHHRDTAWVDARNIAGGEENRSADLGNRHGERTNQTRAVHRHRRGAVLNLFQRRIDAACRFTTVTSRGLRAALHRVEL